MDISIRAKGFAETILKKGKAETGAPRWSTKKGGEIIGGPSLKGDPGTPLWRGASMSILGSKIGPTSRT